jgi:hypothetical protein
MMPARDKIRQDDHQIAGTVRHAAAPHLKPRGTTVNRLPLVYKRKRWLPSRGETDSSLTYFSSFTHDIGICLNQSLGIWSHFLLSCLACSLPLRAPRCLAIQRHECTPAGCKAHDRNQDKPRVPVLLSAGHREIDLSASTS